MMKRQAGPSTVVVVVHSLLTIILVLCVLHATDAVKRLPMNTVRENTSLLLCVLWGLHEHNRASTSLHAQYHFTFPLAFKALAFEALSALSRLNFLHEKSAISLQFIPGTPY